MIDTVDSSLFQQIKTIAIIGAKDKPNSDVDRVGRYLMDAGFSVIPVHPVRENIWGLPTYKSVLDITEQVDLLDVFRASEHCVAHAQEACAMRMLPRFFWMQSGIRNNAAKNILESKGIHVVQDRCIMLEHARLFGRHTAGHGTKTILPLK